MRTTSLKSLDINPPAGAQSAPANIIFRQFEVSNAPIPLGYTDIDSLISEHSADNEYKTALSNARKELSEIIYSKDPKTLASLRLAKGWSQTDLAKLINTSQAHVARIEAGRSDLQLSTIKKLCQTLSISADELVEAYENCVRNADE